VAALSGECGSVRELLDLGDSTCDGLIFREPVLAAFISVALLGTAATRLRFLGTSMFAP